MFNNKFTKKDPVADVISQIISERWDDDDEDDDVRRADAELRRMKAKPIEADKKTDPDKEIGKLAKKTPKEVDEEVVSEGSGPKEKQHTPYSSIEQKHKEGSEYSKQIRAKYDQEKKAKAAAKIGMKKEEAAGKGLKKADKDYDKDGKIESGKDEFWGSRLRAAKMKNEDKWTDIADGPWKKSKKSSSQAMSSAHNLSGKGMKDAKSLGRKPDLKAAASYLKSKIAKEEVKLIESNPEDMISDFNDRQAYLGHKKMERSHIKQYKATSSPIKQSHHQNMIDQHSSAASEILSKYHKESKDLDLQEKTLTPAESKKKEEIVKSMKKDKKGLKARYGKRWKEVAYATATKSAKRVAEETNLQEEYADMSHAAKELVLHADNHAHLYHSSHTPIMNNLKKKMKNGTYDSGKAKKLWAYHADRAAQSYAKEHGDGRPWHKMFSTSDRKQAASHWEDMHKHELHESKGPTSTYGLETFATNESPTSPLEKAKSVAHAALLKVKNEMLGKAGATSEEIDPRIKTTDTLKGRNKGGKDDDVGPSATGRATKVKFTPGPK